MLKEMGVLVEVHAVVKRHPDIIYWVKRGIEGAVKEAMWENNIDGYTLKTIWQASDKLDVEELVVIAEFDDGYHKEDLGLTTHGIID